MTRDDPEEIIHTLSDIFYRRLKAALSSPSFYYPFLTLFKVDNAIVQRSGAWYISLGYLKNDNDVNKVEAWRALIRQLLVSAERDAPEFRSILSKIVQARNALAKRNSLRDYVRQFLEGRNLKMFPIV